ncbi:FkbM family methyltransferase [Nocardioides sp. W7]|uniref:FkbM family methyltransferase n=1 Tax=Nocardioides sp. W7 TaxID=2931390 RepID=UPI001FD11805|nr:FkbM family methyltransferase [Nocardioides sp. W7]
MKRSAAGHALRHLLQVDVNAHRPSEVGAESNEQLRTLFLSLLETIGPRVFLDIGARDAESAMAVADAHPDCRCIAFEANPHIYAQFADAVAEHGRVDYRHLAVSDTAGEIELFIPRVSTEIVVGDEIVASHHVEAADTGRSSLLKRTDAGAQYDIVTVAATSLDQLARAEGLTKHGELALWIDVEGAAKLVIDGGRRTLARAAVVLIEVEGHAFWDGQSTSHTVISQLIDLGLVPVARDREYYDKQFNVVLVRADLLPQLGPQLFDANSALTLSRTNPEREPSATAATVAALEERLERLERALDSKQSAPAPDRSGPLDSAQSSSGSRPARTYPPLVGRFTPILIPTFNNPTFARAMVEQLEARHHANIVILDNASTSPEMLRTLDDLRGRATVRRLLDNRGPRRVWDEPEIYDALPQVFGVTDPDLQLHPALPDDFIEQLYTLTVRHQVGKAGMALDISNVDALVDNSFVIGGSPYKIWEWEAQYWTDQVEADVYRAAIDTTFAIYNKDFFDKADPLLAVRVGGDFTCQHLPWLKTFALPADEVDYYRSTNTHSFYLPNRDHGPPSA